MKTAVLILPVIVLSFMAGCTQPHTEYQSAVSGGTMTTGFAGSASPYRTLDMEQPAVLTNGSWSIIASIDHIETDSSKPGKHRIDIYTKIENAGSVPLLPVWFTRVTDLRGVQHGGPGISHGGAGVEGPLLDPGSSVIARDYFTVESDADFIALSEGGVLDIVVTGYRSDLTEAAVFRSAWKVRPGTLR